MTAMDTEIQYRRLRAPREHGVVYLDPPRASAELMLRHNLALRSHWGDCDIHGLPLTDLSGEARRLLVADARQYTGRYRDVPNPASPSDATPIVIAGHQPQLSHPGVWVKNFLLDSLAQECQGVAVHLLIDNDLVRTTSIRVPTGSIAEPGLEAVPFDRPLNDMPFEERNVGDPDRFASFATRVQRAMSPFVSQPMVETMWPWAVEAVHACRNLGRSVAQARHRLEETWGLTTLELPLSDLCDTAPFRRFMLHLLEGIPKLHQHYNDALDEYRSVHRIRSRSHPVANLTSEDGWFETPFWIWTAQAPVRRHLFVRFRNHALHLEGREPAAGGRGGPAGSDSDLRFTIDGRADRGIEQLAQLRGQGVKLRPRALMTTMYARLVLGDLFVHGIGGAKYDQLTDVLIQRFFQIEPPGFVTVSATFHLPIPRPNVSPDDVRHLDWLLRDSWYHPERHLDGESPSTGQSREVMGLAAEKKDWVAMQLPQGKRRERHRKIEQLNQQMRRHLADQRDQLLQERERLKAQLRNESILASREYAFCLFPEEALRGPMLALARGGTP